VAKLSPHKVYTRVAECSNTAEQENLKRENYIRIIVTESDKLKSLIIPYPHPLKEALTPYNREFLLKGKDQYD
jgi:hypothetical protein